MGRLVTDLYFPESRVFSLFYARDLLLSEYVTQEIYFYLNTLLEQIRFPARVTHVNIAVFNVELASPIQLGLFDGTKQDTKSLARAADAVNDRYGEFTLIPAQMANMQHVIIKRVPFGSVRDI